MPDIRRLKTRRDFLRVAAARRKRVRPGLIVQAARRTGPRGGPASSPPGQGQNGEPACAAQGAIRVGFTASRKVGSAVDRNRARRRLRAAAAEVLPALGQATLERRYEDLVRDLHEALIQLGYDGKASTNAPRRRRRVSSGRRASAPGDRR